MDKTSPVKEDSSELRELLIAISESGPDKVVDSTPDHENSNLPNGTELSAKEIIAEKLRSDLISISYSPSDSIALPATGPQDG